MTESPPVEAAEAEPKVAAEVAAEGLYTWLSTSDHKVIGRIWIRLSLLMLAAAWGLTLGLGVLMARRHKGGQLLAASRQSPAINTHP